VNLDIERGKINIIIGGSGQGKSVLHEAPHGAARPGSAGHIYVDGQDIVGLGDVAIAKIQRKFGMVFPVRRALRLAQRSREHRVSAAGAVSAAHSRKSWTGCVRCSCAWTWPDVPGVEQKFPAELSGGMRKRVGLARALIDRPEILLYDEPTTGLDPIATKNVDQMIRRTADEFAVTSVVISHDMASTFRIGGSHRHALRWRHRGERAARRNPCRASSGFERNSSETFGRRSTSARRGAAGVRRSLAAVDRRCADPGRTWRRAYLLFQYTSERMSGGKGYRVYASVRQRHSASMRRRVCFPLACGLGQVEERVLDQESGKAKVFLRIDPGDSSLRERGSSARRSASLLGEYYLDIDPGTPFVMQGRTEGRGTAVLKEGDQIKMSDGARGDGGHHGLGGSTIASGAQGDPGRREGADVGADQGSSRTTRIEMIESATRSSSNVCLGAWTRSRLPSKASPSPRRTTSRLLCAMCAKLPRD
jgi:phospholipid/cholesterol/gamma-HCH transport system ATP-binding protein